MILKTPPYLKKGDTIGLICPAGFMPAENTTVCIETLKKWGYNVKVGKTVGQQSHYFSGEDAERLQDLQDMLDDHSVSAILCARGGYGCSRIVDEINWNAFRKNPKWLIGFSDITVFNNHLYQKLKTSSIHGPMAGAFHKAGGTDAYILTLKQALSGRKMRYKSEPHAINKFGKVSGPLVGGNLSILAHLVGTPSFPDTKDCLLFLEDVGEYLYNVDRMLLQLDRAGKLHHLGGLIIGGFSDCKDTVVGFGKNIYEIIQNRVAPYSFPIAYGFPVSHEKENVALKIGVVHHLQVTKSGVVLREAK